MTTSNGGSSSWISRPARWRLVTLALLIALCVLTACGRDTEDDRLHIRIHNATGLDINKFWLGTGSGAGGPPSQAYGAIADGETTRYRSRQTTFGSYSNFNFIAADGRRFLGTTIAAYDRIGQFTLEPGYYTFVLTRIDPEIVVTIHQDEAP